MRERERGLKRECICIYREYTSLLTYGTSTATPPHETITAVIPYYERVIRVIRAICKTHLKVIRVIRVVQPGI